MTAIMKPFAESMGLIPPMGVDDHQKEYDKVCGLSGADFDLENLGQMVSDRAKALDDFISEAKDTRI
jgi:hypothetical protein